MIGIAIIALLLIVALVHLIRMTEHHHEIFSDDDWEDFCK